MGKKHKMKSEKFAKVTVTHAETETEPKAEPRAEPKNREMLEKALQTLRDLGGKTTSPQLVKALHFEGESARDKVRRLMDDLVVHHKVKETKNEETNEVGRKGQYIYEAVEAAA